MYKNEVFINNCESIVEESNSYNSNILDYISDKTADSINLESSKEQWMQINNESCVYNTEKELYTTQLDNIHEEEIVVEKTIEYSSKLDMFDAAGEKSDIRSSSISPNLTYSHLFNDKTDSDSCRRIFLEANASGKSLNLVKSKSLTDLDHIAPNQERQSLKEVDENTDEQIMKYSTAFLNNERTLQELQQQNMLAQDLLKKYFKDDEEQIKVESKPRRSSVTNKKHSQVKPTETISSQMKRYFNRMDENDQVCIKPSDEYVFLSTKDTSKKNSVKFVKPFKYHQKYWESGSNLEVISKTDPPFKFEGAGRKRSRLEFESNVALKQDSSTDFSLKTQNVQFLVTGGHKRLSDLESNKILYKTDSKNFENSYSLEELHTFMPERYETLRNLYGCNYVEEAVDQKKLEPIRPRYSFQTLPNRNSKRGEFVKFFDSGSHIKVTDDDYKKWLKERNLLRYTDFAKSSVTSITCKSISQKIVNYSLTPSCKTNREKKKSRTNIMNRNQQIGFTKFVNTATIPSLTNTTTENYKFVDIEYSSLYQLVTYEHIVISNLINFYCSFNATRIRKLTVVDRMYQLMFLLFCYYVLSFMNSNVFGPFDEKWF